MSQRTATLKEELLEKVATLIAKRMTGAKAKAAQEFVDHYYANVPPSDMAQHDPEDLYGAAISMWTWGQSRTADAPKIRVYNPRYDQHGWHSPHTVIEIVNDDMPFLVDSVTMEMNRQNLTVHLVVHPVYHAVRDDKGKTKTLKTPNNGKMPATESYMHLEVDEQTLPEALAAIEEGLLNVLTDVRSSVEDWPQMRKQAADLLKDLTKKKIKGVAGEEIEEACAFLQWVYDDHYTFLGYRDIDYQGTGKQAKLKVKNGSGLGVLRDNEVMYLKDCAIWVPCPRLSKKPSSSQDWSGSPRPITVQRFTAASIWTPSPSRNMTPKAIRLVSISLSAC